MVEAAKHMKTRSREDGRRWTKMDEDENGKQKGVILSLKSRTLNRSNEHNSKVGGT